MEDKKYLDKVIEHMVRNTKLDHNSGEIITPTQPTFPSEPPYSFFSVFFFPSFSTYCKKHFGLIDDEVKYVYHRYVKIIEEKINQQ